MMKMAAILLRNYLKNTSGKIILLVHDEVVVECSKKDVEQVKTLVEAAMNTAARYFCEKVPPPADAIIADCWYKP